MFPTVISVNTQPCEKGRLAIDRRNATIPKANGARVSQIPTVLIHGANLDDEKIKTRIQQATKEKSLHTLMEGFTKEHAKDIYDLSKGHLNQSKLFDPYTKKSSETGTKWLTSSCISSDPHLLPDRKPDSQRETLMKSSLRYFSVDLPNSQREKKIAPKRLVALNSPPGSTGKSVLTPSVRWTDDGVRVEELQHSPCNMPQLDQRETEYSKLGRELARCQFMPNHLHSVTKKDQLKKLLLYEKNVLRRSDAQEQHVLSGVKAVKDLEMELQMAIEMLHQNGHGPNFHRLQIYSDIFEKLIGRSSTFGHVLWEIKASYDDYVAALLDGPMGQHKMLTDQLKQVSTGLGYNMGQLDEEMDGLARMETEAKEALQENDRLRKLVIEKEALKEQVELAQVHSEQDLVVESGSQRPVSTTTARIDTDISDKIERLHSAIWQKLNSATELRQTLNEECVPIAVCTHLRQCVKDTEAELQKLHTQQDYIDKNSKALTEQLIKDVSAADTTEKDARRIWKKINAEDEEGDEYYDDEKKWSWYIS